MPPFRGRSAVSLVHRGRQISVPAATKAMVTDAAVTILATMLEAVDTFAWSDK
jgi:hypothetical protein